MYLKASLNLPENIPADKVKLFVRAPFEKPIKSVMVNGKGWNNWDRKRDAIVLPTQSKTIDVLVSY